jgi:hypothetical protein
VQKEVVTFYGLEDVVQTISTGHINTFRSFIPFLKAQEKIQYKLTRPAYTSKLLTGLLKEEYEERTFSNRSTMMVSPKVWGELLKL